MSTWSKIELVINRCHWTSRSTMSTLCLSLDSLEANIEHAIDNKAALIFWHHSAQRFTYFCSEDKDQYCQEMRNLRSGVRNGQVKKVKKGASLTVGQSSLFTMEVEFKDNPCHAWFLLQQNGLIEDADFTPYFFKSEQKRDELVSYLQKGQN